jgi:hypothetical protein
MTIQEAKALLSNIQIDYASIPYPKYLHANLDDLDSQYQKLNTLKDQLKDDFAYVRLLNSVTQTLKKMKRASDKSTWMNASERGINKAIPPVIRKGNGENILPFHWESEKSREICSIINGYWSARNYMVMDFVGYIFLLKAGGEKLPQEVSPLFDGFDSIKKRELELDGEGESNESQKSRYTISFSDKHFRKFTEMKMSSSAIFNLLLETSRVEFKLSFPVRLIMGEGKKGIPAMEEKWYPMNVYSRLFEVACINTDIRKDGIVQKRQYRLYFNTILGELFVHNLLTRNYDWVNSDLYNLPPSAQVFYRHFLLHHNYTRLQLNMSKIMEEMNFRDKNITNRVRNLEVNTLDPLVGKGLILSYQKLNGLNEPKYEILLPRKKKDKNEEIDERE